MSEQPGSTWNERGWLGIIRSVAGALTALAACLLVATFAATALVVLSPGYGMDEAQLDPRYNGDQGLAVPDRNVARLYWVYLCGLMHGDLGTSSSFNEPVSILLLDRFGITASNVGHGLVLAWVFSLTLSAWGLLPSGRRIRPPALVGGLLILCVPSALIALAGVMLKLGPAPAIGVVVFPRLHRYTDDLLQEFASRTYVVSARARGLDCCRLIANHVIRPALPELAALAGASMNIAIGASIPIEVLSDNPGMSQLAWRGALSRDVQLVAGVTLFISLLTITANGLSSLIVTVAKRPA